ncbi:MAG: baseplate assembly protein [Desulfuromonadaceae bacterium]|nr:baseplate assembly protein [Desulfuromonadaceae bacterium]MDD5107552.1 baseplate assembly protein [Desulfuromonadaceae bacterium]
MPSEVDLKKLLKRVVELVMPNLRHYYRPPRKGRVVKAYASDGQYWADVQPLRNDDSVDDNEPIVTRIEIPILWGGPARGVVCPPTVGTLCDITYYDGDPNYPRISNFRWAKNTAPNCELGAFIIQQSPEVYIKITAEGNIVDKTSSDKNNEIGGAKNETVGADWNIEVTGTASVTAAAIHLNGGASVVTTAHTCHLWGGPHGHGSSTVTAGF